MIINIDFFKYTRSIRMTRLTYYLNRTRKKGILFLLYLECSFAILSSFSFFHMSRIVYVRGYSFCLCAILFFDRSANSTYIRAKEHILMYTLNDSTPVQSTYLNSIFLFCHSIATRLNNSNRGEKKRIFLNYEFCILYPCAPVPSNSSVSLYLSLNDISEYELAVRRFFFFCCLFCTLFVGELSDLHPAFVVSRRTSSLNKLRNK